MLKVVRYNVPVFSPFECYILLQKHTLSVPLSAVCLHGSKQCKHAHECQAQIDNTINVTKPAHCRTVVEYFMAW